MDNECCVANRGQLADRAVQDAANPVPQWGQQGCLLSAVRRPEDRQWPARQHHQG